LKALIATPLLDGRAGREFINGLLQCHGLYYAWACIEGQANISLARDMLAAQFLASDCTSLVFIDGDIGFGRKDLQALIDAPQPLIGGLCPRKCVELDWACVPLDDQPLPADVCAPIEVRHTATGFLRIDRRVFTDLIAAGRPTYPDGEGRTMHHFFGSAVVDGAFLSEDYFFCELAARTGYAVHVHPGIRLRHVGRWTFGQTGIQPKDSRSSDWM